MKKSKLVFLLPLATLLASCVTTDFNPFQEDDYVPIGWQTETIARSLNLEETTIMEDSFDRVDNYITGQKYLIEQREYYSSYFDEYAPNGTSEVDYASSISVSEKTYNNNVKTSLLAETDNMLSDYLDVTNVLTMESWTFLPTAATFEIRRSLVVNDADAVVTTYATGAYDEALDYQTRFGYGVGNLGESIYDSAMYVGVNANDDIIAINRISNPFELDLARNGYVRAVTDVIEETKYVLYEPEDSDDPLYLPVQYREYTEHRAISEIYHDNQVIQYLDQPIIIGYSEVIYEWMTEDYGDYVLGDIPEVTTT